MSKETCYVIAFCMDMAAYDICIWSCNIMAQTNSANMEKDAKPAKGILDDMCNAPDFGHSNKGFLMC